MNTQHVFGGRTARRHARAPFGLGTAAARLLTDEEPQRWPESPGMEAKSPHALVDNRANAHLAHCEESVKGRFDRIVPALQALGAVARDGNFAARSQALLMDRLGHGLPDALLTDAWATGIDVKAAYAHCIFRALLASAAQFADAVRSQQEFVRDVDTFFAECGFHTVDISPCADGRLKGLMRYILRLPLSSFARRTAYAGALFDVETDVRSWVATELRRFREGRPTPAADGTRYLKVAVYHTSSSCPATEGCAAHGSNELGAIDAALGRLREFRQAIENAFCCGASTDVLLIGVDTDTDAIKVHVPDAHGELSAYRTVDAAQLYADTCGRSADDAKRAVYEAIRQASAAQGWAAGDGEPHDGMRRLIAHLLINNFSQIAYVAHLYGGRYPDIGHAERYISVGDSFEEMQMRNVAYHAYLHTVEEGAADLDVGVGIFRRLNVGHGLPIPVAIHYRYDARVPGARARAVTRAQRVCDAIQARYPGLSAGGQLVCHLSVQDLPVASPVEEV